MVSLTSTGLGSGIDVNELVSQLVASERKATDTRLDTQEATIQAKISSLGTVKSAFSDLKSTLSALKLPSTFQKVTATSSDSGAISASAATNADLGNYSIEVEQLAQNHTLATSAFNDPNAIVGTGTLVIKFGTTDYDKDTDAYNGFTQNPENGTLNLIIDSSNNTLTGIRDAINKADAGVNAAIINDGNGYRLVLNAADGGAKNSMQISVADGDGNHTDTSGLSALAFNANATNMEQTRNAQDATMLINGLQVTSTSNTVTDALKGVTLNLLQAQPGKAVQIGVSQNTDDVTKAVESFISKYNELNSTVSSVANYDSVNNVGGILQSDALVRGAMAQVRSVLSSAVQGLDGSVRSLVDIGITTEKDGSLAFDSAKLTAALNNDRQGVAALFAVQGRTTDSGVTYLTSTSDTKTGNYAVNISQMATQGYFTGGALLTTTVDASNDSFKINVDGTESGVITLSQGTYTGESLALELQSRINGDSALKGAGVSSVDVTFNAIDNRFEMTSKRYGAASGIALLDVEGTGLGLDDGIGVGGQDVAGTIGGFTAEGNAQDLMATEGDAMGLGIAVESGVAGDRGSITMTHGLIESLDNILNSLVQTKGAFSSSTEGLEKSLSQIQNDRQALEAKMEKYQTRLLARFNAMDSLVARFQSTSSYLSQQLSTLPFANLNTG